jgi:hypothetical protein
VIVTPKRLQGVLSEVVTGWAVNIGCPSGTGLIRVKTTSPRVTLTSRAVEASQAPAIDTQDGAGVAATPKFDTA